MTNPNILVIMSDQHNARYMGCAGHPLVQTPNIDRLAGEGTRFSQAACASPLCGPSRMSFLTSLYPCNSGVYANGQTLASDLPTFAHAFGAAGYDTALIGRMHITGPDQHHGFAEKLAGDVTASTMGGGLFPLTEGLPCGGQSEGLRLSGPGDSTYQHYDDDVTHAAVEWIGQRGNQPFMGVVGFALPHNPYICSSGDYALYEGKIDPPEVDAEALHPLLISKHERETEGMGEEEIRRSLAAYAGSCTATDRRVGRILDALERAGLADSTLVIYTSDHGDAAGEHGLWHKSTMLAGSVGVPLVMRLPGVIPAGVVREEHVNLIDLAPTMSDLADVDSLPAIDGRSLAPLLQGTPEEWDNVTFSEYGTRWGREVLMRMCCRDGWKYIYYHGWRPSLFHLNEDPDEMHDLAEDPAASERLARFEKETLRGWDPDVVNAGLDRWKARNALIYKWFARCEPHDEEIYRDGVGHNRLDAVPDWQPQATRPWHDMIGSY